MRAVLITATDTGVGKTFIAYNLVYALKERGVKVGYLKPIETDVKDVPQDGCLALQSYRAGFRRGGAGQILSAPFSLCGHLGGEEGFFPCGFKGALP
jgi:molybdopterin-guanine dinucleotide biosynthesis protein